MLDLPQATLHPTVCTPLASPPRSLLLAAEPQSVGHARAFTREHVGHHAPHATEHHTDTVVLITSELVTNAYRYGTEPGDLIAVVVDIDDARTRIEVHDPVRRLPRRRAGGAEPGHEPTRGRGLLILDALCPERWGVGDRPLGKFVWAEVPYAD
ncbi:ATP-binding protein [Streptomyces sp. ATexAB-D23]|uniref:ATP-binding protein n=1 Tax=unclassified Streptomyces TaxID=2593676 RepID=UPI00036B3008|nr:ATP-binding protein [Streptomyces sp. ATexAB-D23]MYY00985.1 ATP-binding protein [Streptomyces sp. SID4913]